LNQGRFSGIIFSGVILHEDPLNLPANRSNPMSHIRLAQRVLIGATPFLLAFLVAGCFWNPVKAKGGGDGGGPVVYEIPQSPYNVLNNLKTAYEHRDSVRIGQVYDINYQGTSFDPANLNPITITRQDEIRHVQALYKAPGITSISLTYPGALVRYTDFSDPPGWATITFRDMLLDINDTPDSYHLLSTEGWEFKFIPQSPDSTSPTDTTWKIVRWTEVP